MPVAHVFLMYRVERDLFEGEIDFDEAFISHDYLLRFLLPLSLGEGWGEGPYTGVSYGLGSIGVKSAYLNRLPGSSSVILA